MRKLLFITLGILAYATTFAQNITTIAGNGTAAYGGDGSAATSANLNLPFGVAVDGSGNVYIVDQLNHRIRKVTVSTGIISTVAGNGTAGYGGDGSAATSANLFYPRGVAVDGSGNIYIADFINQRIRKVTASTGIISTVAGNGTRGYGGDGSAAISANLNNPTGVAIDGSGNIYIADYTNNRIRKVTASTGIISTVAGNGTQGYGGDGSVATSANLDSPFGVAVDGSGNIYIADASNHSIRKVTASTGVISTVAGNGTQGYGGDGSTATSANLYNPSGVTVDGSGNIYIADVSNHRIRKVTASTGIISTVAGNGTQGYGGDGSAATSANLNLPLGVAVDGSGNIYIADQINHRIRKVNFSIPDSLSLNIDTIHSPFGGNSTTVNVTSNRSWTVSSNQNWATANTVSGTSNGSFSITTVANTSTDRNATITVTAGTVVKTIYVIQLHNSTGVNSIASFNKQILVYPNPNNGEFIIQSNKLGNYQIINELGQTVKQFEINNSGNSIINMENISSGVYFIIGNNCKQKMVVIK